MHAYKAANQGLDWQWIWTTVPAVMVPQQGPPVVVPHLPALVLVRLEKKPQLFVLTQRRGVPGPSRN